jgi:O-antigen/teichoic acid export membrane protein
MAGPARNGISNLKRNDSTYIRGGDLRAACLAAWRRALHSDFAAKMAETVLTRVLLIGIGLIVTMLVARMLGPEGRGLYAVATTVAGMGVQFGNLGLYASNTYFVSRDRQLLPELLGISLVVSFGFGSLIVGLSYVLFAGWPKLAPVSGLPLIISLVWVPFGLAYLLLQNLLLGLQKVRDYNKIELASKTSGGLFILLLVAGQRLTVEAALMAALLGVIMGFAWSLGKFRGYFGLLSLPSYNSFKEQFLYGLRAYVAALLAFLGLRINLLMITFLQDPEQAGYYSIASSMAEMVYILPAMVGMILFPKIAAMNSVVEKWRFAKKVTLGLGILMLFFTIGAAFLARPAIRLVFGVAFLPSVPPFLWLLPGIFLLSINNCYMNFFAAIGMPMISVYAPGLALLVNFLLNLISIPYWGIVGASLSTVAASGVMLSASLIYISKLRIPRDGRHSFL